MNNRSHLLLCIEKSFQIPGGLKRLQSIISEGDGVNIQLNLVNPIKNTDYHLIACESGKVAEQLRSKLEIFDPLPVYIVKMRYIQPPMRMLSKLLDWGRDQVGDQIILLDEVTGTESRFICASIHSAKDIYIKLSRIAEHGNSDIRLQVNLSLPKRKVEDCKLGVDCKERKTCTLKHPKCNKTCTLFECKHDHPKSRPKRCKEGAHCNQRETCSGLHPAAQQAGTKKKLPVTKLMAQYLRLFHERDVETWKMQSGIDSYQLEPNFKVHGNPQAISKFKKLAFYNVLSKYYETRIDSIPIEKHSKNAKDWLLARATTFRHAQRVVIGWNSKNELLVGGEKNAVCKIVDLAKEELRFFYVTENEWPFLKALKPQIIESMKETMQKENGAQCWIAFTANPLEARIYSSKKTFKRIKQLTQQIKEQSDRVNEFVLERTCFQYLNEKNIIQQIRDKYDVSIEYNLDDDSLHIANIDANAIVNKVPHARTELYEIRNTLKYYEWSGPALLASFPYVIIFRVSESFKNVYFDKVVSVVDKKMKTKQNSKLNKSSDTVDVCTFSFICEDIHENEENVKQAIKQTAHYLTTWNKRKTLLQLESHLQQLNIADKRTLETEVNHCINDITIFTKRAQTERLKKAQARLANLEKVDQLFTLLDNASLALINAECVKLLKQFKMKDRDDFQVQYNYLLEDIERFRIEKRSTTEEEKLLAQYLTLMDLYAHAAYLEVQLKRETSS